MTSPPVIALLTDFGLLDHYVGTMKGVMLGICRDATLVDITHDIPPHDVLAASLELGASYRFFPAGTVFVAVVDPGVGTARRPIAAAASGYRFVAPDNGVLTRVLNAHAPESVVELTTEKYRLPEISRTFEGRDRFAPAAAWLARGAAINDLGPGIDSWTRLDIPTPSIADGSITGCVLRVDRFGNLITNIDRATLVSVIGDAVPHVQVGDRPVECFVGTYGHVAEGGVCALFGSSGFVEIAVNCDSAATRLGAGRGSIVRVVC